MWSPDGKEIYYEQGAAGVGDLMAVTVQTELGFVFTKPTPLPIKAIRVNGGPGNPRGYDITPDGKQFLVMYTGVNQAESERESQQINVTLNWFEELKQRVR